jgi:hypothetical protein
MQRYKKYWIINSLSVKKWRKAVILSFLSLAYRFWTPLGTFLICKEYMPKKASDFFANLEK